MTVIACFRDIGGYNGNDRFWPNLPVRTSARARFCSHCERQVTGRNRLFSGGKYKCPLNEKERPYLAVPEIHGYGEKVLFPDLHY